MAKKTSSSDAGRSNRYGELLTHIFSHHYAPGVKEFEFARNEIEAAANTLSITLPKNLGDLLYSFRYRTPMPAGIAATAEPDYGWEIELVGRGKYRMIQRKIVRIVPSANYLRIKIPDATPEIVTAYALTDEQALLAKVRYNRLIDIFLRVTAYSLQNHLRTTVQDVGQIETDEVYVAVNNTGQQFVIPVQAKGGNDQIGGVQIRQDLALCREKYPALTPRSVAVQFVREQSQEVIVMFELTEAGGEICVVDEKHYKLVPASDISDADLAQSRTQPR